MDQMFRWIDDFFSGFYDRFRISESQSAVLKSFSSSLYHYQILEMLQCRMRVRPLCRGFASTNEDRLLLFRHIIIRRAKVWWKFEMVVAFVLQQFRLDETARSYKFC